METAEESAIGFLSENLLQLIKENHDLISGAGSKVTKLSDNLDLLKSVVTRYTEKHFENETLSKLAKQIRSLIHEAEDAIEEYVYYVALHRSKGTFDKALGILSYTTNVLLEDAIEEFLPGVAGADKMNVFQDAAVEVVELTGKKIRSAINSRGREA
ncbi:hypothetical protein ACH5RR_030235 [Cinchona calisaya]|uniref:Disease resistance N-terminal domain-containing protein n=1 Tax=Cinchona calisaya TaxID=153742 RepID=A0ABD2YX30_9GENT